MKKLISLMTAALFLLTLLGGCSQIINDYNSEQSYKNSRAQVLEAHKRTFHGRGYACLKTKEEQDAYAAIDVAANEVVSVTFDIPSGDVFDNFSDILEIYKNDHPDVFWIKDDVAYSYIDRGSTVTIELAFKSRGDELTIQRARLDKAVNKILETAPVQGSDYEKELFVNNWLIDNCEYDEDAVTMHREQRRIRGNEQDVYGALVEGKAVCEGYARAFQLLCTKLNLDCSIVEGYALEKQKDGKQSRTPHVWNCIKLNDAWYYVDVTWNDDVDEAFKNVASRRYYYLNLTTKDIEHDHELSPLYGEKGKDADYRNHFIPECNATEFNFFHLTCRTLTDVNEGVFIVDALTGAAKGKMTYFDFLVDESLDFNEVKKKISEGKGFEWIQEANKHNDDDHQLTDKCSLYAFEDRNMITFLLKYKG